MHPLEKVFDEFSEPTTVANLIAQADAQVRKGRKSRLKGGQGETLSFIHMQDGLAILLLLPPGVEPRGEDTAIIYQLFQIPGSVPKEDVPDGIAFTDSQEHIIGRLRERVMELCSCPS